VAQISGNKKASCTIWTPAQKAFERLQMNTKSNSHQKSSSFIYSTFTGKIGTTPREVSETWPLVSCDIQSCASQERERQGGLSIGVGH
jgi:hypothetical protein